MRQIMKAFPPIIMLLAAGASTARAADFREGPYAPAPPHAERCCTDEVVPFWERPRPSGPHGGFLPVYRGGCWHWWYDQWSRVC
jgi:hypothetical protein